MAAGVPRAGMAARRHRTRDDPLGLAPAGLDGGRAVLPLRPVARVRNPSGGRRQGGVWPCHRGTGQAAGRLGLSAGRAFVPGGAAEQWHPGFLLPFRGGLRAAQPSAEYLPDGAVAQYLRRAQFGDDRCDRGAPHRDCVLPDAFFWGYLPPVPSWGAACVRGTLPWNLRQWLGTAGLNKSAAPLAGGTALLLISAAFLRPWECFASAWWWS